MKMEFDILKSLTCAASKNSIVKKNNLMKGFLPEKRFKNSFKVFDKIQELDILSTSSAILIN